LTAVAVGVRLLLNPWLGYFVPYGTFFISVTLSAVLGGAIPGLLAVLLGTLASAYFFIPPVHSLRIAAPEHALMLTVNAAVSVALVVLADLQRRAKEKAAEGQRTLDAVMAYIPQGLAILDADGKFRMASRHGAKLMGRRPGSQGPKDVAEIVPRFFHCDGTTPARQEELPGSRAIEHGSITEDEEWVIKRPDGTTLMIVTSAAPIRDVRGRITGAVVAARDITERKRLEQKLRESAKLESLGVLAGGIAHDFNNLLTSVLGHASLLLKELPEGSRASSSAREILHAAERAARLSSQMLAYSGRGRFVVERLDLSAHIRRLAPQIESAVSGPVELRFDLAPELPPVQADASQIRELLMNLVHNGVEAIGPHAGRVTVATRLVPVDQLYTHGPLLHEEVQPGIYIALEVIDTGSGMDKETASRMFDPFFTTKFPGRGMGLAVAQGIVRGHKGAILVYSSPGAGTRVSALFPAAVPAAPSTTSEAGALQR
jgi:PAS domain S-box-containing protein